MVVAQACEVEETRVTLTARKQTTVARATFLYNIKKKYGNGANILCSFWIDGDYS